MNNKEIQVRELNIHDINNNLLEYFNRYQEVTKALRVENGKKVIKDIRFIELWDDNKKQEVIKEFRETLLSNGTLFGAFEGIKLVGFASLSGFRLGENKEYIQLLQLHVSNDFRGKGIGQMLFNSCTEKASRLGARKLYISAHSAVETQSFYTRVGCVDARWLYKEQVELEPYDCQLEYEL